MTVFELFLIKRGLPLYHHFSKAKYAMTMKLCQSIKKGISIGKIQASWHSAVIMVVAEPHTLLNFKLTHSSSSKREQIEKR